MRNKNEIYEVEREYKEVVKEYYITLPKKNLKVIGRITKHTNGDHIMYWGSFSHFYLTGKEAIEYFREFDDQIRSNDFEITNIQVIQYMEAFTTEFGEPLKNKHF